MRRLALKVFRAILLLLATGWVKAAQLPGNIADQGEAGTRGALVPAQPSPVAPWQGAIPLPHFVSEAGKSEGTGVGIRIPPPVVRRPARRRSPLLIGLYASQGVLQGLDAQSSLRALGTGAAREANPLLSPFASHPATLILFKAAMAAGTIYALDRLYKFNPRLAISTLGAIDGGYGIIVQRNYRSFPVH